MSAGISLSAYNLFGSVGGREGNGVHLAWVAHLHVAAFQIQFSKNLQSITCWLQDFMKAGIQLLGCIYC